MNTPNDITQEKIYELIEKWTEIKKGKRFDSEFNIQNPVRDAAQHEIIKEFITDLENLINDQFPQVCIPPKCKGCKAIVRTRKGIQRGWRCAIHHRYLGCTGPHKTLKEVINQKENEK